MAAAGTAAETLSDQIPELRICAVLTAGTHGV